jgi:hypothetical protein
MAKENGKQSVVENDNTSERIFNVEDLRQALFGELATRLEPLVGEEKSLKEELDRLSQSTPALQATAEAKIRLLQRELDEQLATGNFKASEKIQVEVESAQTKLNELLERPTKIHQRLEKIQAEKLAAANRTLNTVFPVCQNFAFGVLNEAFTLLDGVWGLLQEFGAVTGVKISVMNHRNKLRPYAMGAGKSLHGLVSGWFPGS